MIVVADAGPLHYLILLEQAGLLHLLYGDVLIPTAVHRELSARCAPRAVRDWCSHPPPWLRIEAVTTEQLSTIPEDLDPGEREAIALACRLRADLLLIDELAGRAEARRRGLRITGTLGVLRAAAEKGLIDVPVVLERLRATSF